MPEHFTDYNCADSLVTIVCQCKRITIPYRSRLDMFVRRIVSGIAVSLAPVPPPSPTNL